MTCAPFLALRVIRQLNLDEGARFSLASPILRDNIYVDDLLFGAHDTRLLREKREELITLLKCGGFELKKWASNSAELLIGIDPRDHGLATPKLFKEHEQLHILGIQWDPQRDDFSFKLLLLSHPPHTKRAILSAIAKIYDPMGWITPVTVAAKIFMQQLWQFKITWDEKISDSLLSHWTKIYNSFQSLNDVRIPRWTGFESDDTQIELHGFADASNVAYAAVVYLRIVSLCGAVRITLLAGKSKVAPIRPLSVPRLKLSAVLLLARLINFVQSSLNEKITRYYCWTDSSVVLMWVTNHPSRWKTFVANRVNKIQSLLPTAEWRHVSTDCNPADCASRGIFGNDIISHPLWWKGPMWLMLAYDKWLTNLQATHLETPMEERVTVMQCSASPGQ